jgi:hypothetical protein
VERDSSNTHGKEGVDGSSPSEGFEKSRLIRRFRELWSSRFQTSTSTERPPPAANASRETSEPCRQLGAVSPGGFAGLRAGVHSASTARSRASASARAVSCGGCRACAGSRDPSRCSCEPRRTRGRARRSSPATRFLRSPKQGLPYLRSARSGRAAQTSAPDIDARSSLCQCSAHLGIGTSKV